MGKHVNDLTPEEMRERLSALGWMALDLAQHLNFANRCLGPGKQRDEAYRLAERMAYDMSDFEVHG